jgi:hypothetical protein
MKEPKEMVSKCPDSLKINTQSKKVFTQAQHIKAAKEKYPCDQCGYKARSIRDMKKHVQGVHGKEKYP